MEIAYMKIAYENMFYFIFCYINNLHKHFYEKHLCHKRLIKLLIQTRSNFLNVSQAHSHLAPPSLL